MGQLYDQFGQGIRSGENCQSDFNTAVELHRLLDHIQEVPVQGRVVTIA